MSLTPDARHTLLLHCCYWDPAENLLHDLWRTCYTADSWESVCRDIADIADLMQRHDPRLADWSQDRLVQWICELMTTDTDPIWDDRIDWDRVRLETIHGWELMMDPSCGDHMAVHDVHDTLPSMQPIGYSAC